MTPYTKKICQRILNQNHPGKNAAQVIVSLCPMMAESEVPHINVLSNLLHDAFSHCDFDRYETQRRSPIKINSLIQEVIFRLLKKWEPSGMNAHLVQLSSACEELHQHYSSLFSIDRSVEGKPEYRAIAQSIAGAINQYDSLGLPVFQVSRARQLLKGHSGKKVRKLVFGEEKERPSSFNFRKLDPALFDRLDAQDRMIDNLDDKELSLRLAHMMKNHELAGYDPDMPVYGVNALYAYLPWALSCLNDDPQSALQPGPFDSTIITNIEKMASEFEAIAARYERIAVKKTRSNDFDDLEF